MTQSFYSWKIYKTYIWNIKKYLEYDVCLKYLEWDVYDIIKEKIITSHVSIWPTIRINSQHSQWLIIIIKL